MIFPWRPADRVGLAMLITRTGRGGFDALVRLSVAGYAAIDRHALSCRELSRAERAPIATTVTAALDAISKESKLNELRARR
jgi:hypothetical protein